MVSTCFSAPRDRRDLKEENEKGKDDEKGTWVWNCEKKGEHDLNSTREDEQIANREKWKRSSYWNEDVRIANRELKRDPSISNLNDVKMREKRELSASNWSLDV